MVEEERKSAIEEKIPERLTDERLGNLISAVGNHEAKAITLLQMRPGIIYSMKDLYRTVIDSQGENVGWRMNESIPFGYCQNSLAPIGLVTREVLDENLNTFGYMISDYGIKTGIPFAGYMLDFSRRHPEISLMDIFAKTGSSSEAKEIEDQNIVFKKRAPITRLKIFWELLTSDLPLREVDLGVRIGENHKLLSSHLAGLATKGLILYQRLDYGSSLSFYQLNPDYPQNEPVAYRNMPSLTNKIYQALLEQPERKWSTRDLAKHLDAYHNTSSVISHLEKIRYAKRGTFSREHRSEISLNEDQRRLLLDLVNTIDYFQSQSPQVLEEGRGQANSFTPSEINSLMRKAREHSPFASKQPIETTRMEILSIITSSLNSLSSSEIMSNYERLFDRSLTRESINLILRQLRQAGKIIYQKENGVRKYSLLFRSNT